MRGTVLIIDDDATIRQTLASFLSEEGYTPVTAEGGQAALELVTRLAPDVILLDMQMPDLTG